MTLCRGLKVNDRLYFGKFFWLNIFAFVSINPLFLLAIWQQFYAPLFWSPSLASQQQLNDFLASVERRAWRQAQYAVRDHEHALDIVQDAMLKLATRYADKPASEWPMLFQTILQNTIRDFLRRNKLRQFWVSLYSKFSSHSDDETDSADPLSYVPHCSELNPSAEQTVLQQQNMALIEEGLALLPARQREAFLLRYWEEMDVQETAQVMGCSVGSVKTHCSRACHTLADWLKQQGLTL